MVKFQDTIAAIATPPGFGGVAMVRVSGPSAKQIAKTMLKQTELPVRQVILSKFYQQDTVLDEGIALYFSNPNSFTGEDVLELQGHGGPVVANMLLKETIRLGARMAEPGEFAKRSFLNDKIDLTQAEAIASLIHASSEQAVLSASRSLQGEFATRIKQLVQKLIKLRVFVEAAIDFPEEEIEVLQQQKIQERLQALQAEVATLVSQAEQGALLQDGANVVLTGKPNAGKSSLLNALTKRESAIVTDIPGTTRDIIRERVNLDGLVVNFIDTAGIRDSEDIVEQHGVARARQAVEDADLILLLVDILDKSLDVYNFVDNFLPKRINQEKIRLVVNKIDIKNNEIIVKDMAKFAPIYLSAKTGEGVDSLVENIKQSLGFRGAEGVFAARQRHVDALFDADKYLAMAADRLDALELLAEDLRGCQQALNQITGEFSTEDLLGEIFSSFCIGK